MYIFVCVCVCVCGLEFLTKSQINELNDFYKSFPLTL